MRFFNWRRNRPDPKWEHIGSEEDNEANRKIVADWARQNSMKYFVYPCGHTACTSQDIEIPKECPWHFNHNKNGRAITP